MFLWLQQLPARVRPVHFRQNGPRRDSVRCVHRLTANCPGASYCLFLLSCRACLICCTAHLDERIGADDRSTAVVAAFEFMDRLSLEYPLGHIPGARDPLSKKHPFYVLIETSGSSEEHDMAVRDRAPLAWNRRAMWLLSLVSLLPPPMASPFLLLWSLTASFTDRCACRNSTSFWPMPWTRHWSKTAVSLKTERRHVIERRPSGGSDLLPSQG